MVEKWCLLQRLWVHIQARISIACLTLRFSFAGWIWNKFDFTRPLHRVKVEVPANAPEIKQTHSDILSAEFHICKPSDPDKCNEKKEISSQNKLNPPAIRVARYSSVVENAGTYPANLRSSLKSLEIRSVGFAIDVGESFAVGLQCPQAHPKFGVACKWCR